MIQILLILVVSGAIAGIVQFFVIYKQLPVYTEPATNSLLTDDEATPSVIRQVWDLLRKYWVFFAYISIGIVGSLLTPLVYAIFEGNLPGLDGIKIHLDCLDGCLPSEPCVCPIGTWERLVLMGYGIVFGYTSIKLIGSLSALLTGTLTKLMEQQQKTNEQLRETLARQQQQIVALVPTKTIAAETIKPLVEKGNEYFNTQQNERDMAAYYDGIGTGGNVGGELTALLTRTHTRQLRYAPSVHLYPVVDRHEGGSLQSIYSGKAFDVNKLIAMDAEADRKREEAAAQMRKVAVSSIELEEMRDRLEDLYPYNCEHVVPQSWFGKKEPMRGDLHHLFTCETDCNSFRGNLKYFDFIDYGLKGDNDAEQGVIRDACGKSDKKLFEPERNKGVVARAVLYFLLRYPGKTVGGYTTDDIPMLVLWHKAKSVSLYERHRNQEIFYLQGNRNPLIDHPEWADKIKFVVTGDLKDATLVSESTVAAGMLQHDEIAIGELSSVGFEACSMYPRPWPGKPWRAAESLLSLRSHVNALAPNRKKTKDGLIGDEAHMERNSDHNPWVADTEGNRGVVTAIDITHDPAGGCDCNKIAESLEQAKDRRVKYVIWNKRIMNSDSISGAAPWTWRTFNGDPHSGHIHVSVKCDKTFRDSTAAWTVAVG